MSDVTIHRMVLEDKDTIGMYIMPGGRHIGHFQNNNSEALNKTNAYHYQYWFRSSNCHWHDFSNHLPPTWLQ